MQTATSSSAKKKEIDTISGSISKRGMNFVVIGKCGSFYIIYHEKAGKKSKSNAPQKTISSLPA